MGMRIVPIYERLRTRKDRPSGLSLATVALTYRKHSIYEFLKCA